VTDVLEPPALREWLVVNDWIVLTGADGVVARTTRFVAVERAVEGLVGRTGADLEARLLRFPPVFPRAAYERTDYLASFPNLTGSVHSFDGDEKAAARIVEQALADEPWGEGLHQTDLMLVSAACHPAYELFAGGTLDSTVLLDVEGWCFRREPSVDPLRVQAFRQSEFVVLGSPERAQQHRDDWAERGLAVLASLGLPAEVEVANDPFFGRSGRMLAANQRAEVLKLEVVVPIYGDERPGTALVSANCHRDHFGVNFDIELPDGSPAHTACVGFGVDRIVVALARHHGPDPDSWQSSVRDLLWP
jgi:seryl-tRNA synthetase